MRAESDARRCRSWRRAGRVEWGGRVVRGWRGGRGVARIASVEVARSLTDEGGTHPN